MMNFRRVFPQGAYARSIVKDVLPGTAAALDEWQRRIATIPNVELQRQAWASITSKRFHAEGGSVYAALAPEHADTLVPLITALQTISDYLDNLCDRSVSMDETDFRQLHRAMLDAVDGTEPASPDFPNEASRSGSPTGSPPYYAHHPNKDDGGYLQALVDECRRQTARLPSYGVVKPYVEQLIRLYNDLQVYKHGPVAGRVPTLERWFGEAHRDDAADLYWWEFAAASGSTLGVFALFTAATRAELTSAEAEAIVNSYFPWICGLHILLDYFIDQAEDVAGGDLNLVSYYESPEQLQVRLAYFVTQARQRAALLPERAFHTTIVQGLPALYLSDEKVAQQRFQPIARRLLRAAGPASFGYYAWCRWRRAFDPLARPDETPAPCDEPGPAG